ncbi:LysR family transcriptional regulator [Pseudomonas plecoglossicida]|uniref:LysR family transcriptional regulator n=1 Tax=Pseudomonas plecoglossicida TaxID=70775 RepID=A0AAD0QZV0_PSEDL|nr:LysR family transcriptional regulator [Pseudomonas plecoglossicida]AXM98017.1 LysR family transcriptional regulator [Pseudomonas plecoglossicida]EPB96055.1 LysR family transcriptional regulator [Pseudomonas plecoglossicida NB2011]QLB54157.1 LysR family transcriptional regulator [Pseudomonas plecoglossicida]
MSLTLKQLKHLQAIHEYGSIHRAAEWLHITQPALTRSLSNLEESLGVRLFDRSKSGMEATEFCRKIRERCAGLLLEANEIEREAELYRNLESGELNLGIGRASRELVLQAVLPEYVKRHPQIKVHVREGASDELVHGLKQGRHDVVIAGAGSYRDIDGLVWQALHNFNVLIFARSGHPLAHQQNITASDLANFPMLSPTELPTNHPVYSQHPDSKKLEPNVLCSDFQVLRRILLDTDAWLAAPEQQFKGELSEGILTSLDVQNWSLMIELGAFEPSGRSRSPATQTFIDLCQQKLSELC